MFHRLPPSVADQFKQVNLLLQNLRLRIHHADYAGLIGHEEGGEGERRGKKGGERREGKGRGGERREGEEGREREGT